MKSPRLTNCRRDCNAGLKPGDITWLKLQGFSWWPAQVVDENSVSENSRPRKKLKGAVLLRLYGSYEYVYHMQPVKSLSEFKNMLEQENCSWRDMVQKAIDQALLNSSSDKSDNSSDSRDTKGRRIPRESSKKVERASSPSKDSNKKSKRRAKQDDAREKDKFDIPVADLTAVEKSPEFSARRLKVMQSLGLMAPSGSPFCKDRHAQTG